MLGRSIAAVMSRPASETDRFAAFAAAIVTHDDARDECTIYPEDVSAAQRQTTWIKAKEGSFCSAREYR